MSIKIKSSSSVHGYNAIEEQAYALGVLAYIYGYPLLQSYRYFYSWALNENGIEYLAAPNQFGHIRRLNTPNDKWMVSPNNDTLYSIASLYLSEEPLILHVPHTGERWYQVQFMNAYTDNFAYLGTRATGGPLEADYAIVGPDWEGKLPENLKVIKATGNTAFIGVRFVVLSEKDLPELHELQNSLVLTPFSRWRQRRQRRQNKLLNKNFNSGLDWDVYDLSEPINAFKYINFMLSINPPPDDEVALMELFDTIGLGSDRRFDSKAFDEPTLNGLRRAVKSAEAIIDYQANSIGQIVGGWVYPPAVSVGDFAHNYLLRAAISKPTYAQNSPIEEYYPKTFTDENGNQLSGENNYVLRFEKGQLPPVNGFWSITIYSIPNYWLVDNPINRYAISDRTENFQYDQDGSLTIYIQNESPELHLQSNWFPSPSDKFYMLARLVNPSKSILDGTYRLPAVVPITKRTHILN